MYNPPNLIYISSSALHQIDQAIPIDNIEYGGALLGPEEETFIDSFILDKHARTDYNTYTPSPELYAGIRDAEFKGIIHSHPQGSSRLSNTDESGMEECLRQNRHMSYLIAIIITKYDSWSQLQDHELLLSEEKKISCYIFYFYGNGVRSKTISVQESI